MHVYSVDEVFMDVTAYLNTYQKTPRELAREIIYDVRNQTGITATAGIGTNMYLCKVAMDIEAKHTEPDKFGVRIASLDEMSYRRTLWTHQPITDFWRVGHGYAKKLAAHGMYTMGDVARCSIGGENEYYNEDLLYKLFGINAELLIDHAWGYEPCTIGMIKQYKPESTSLSTGQVLQCPYDTKKARLIVKEMTDLLVLDLVDKGLVTDQIVLTIGYDKDSKHYADTELTRDRYGRQIPKHAHGTINLKNKTSSTKAIMDATMELYDRIIDDRLLVRRINVVANKLAEEAAVEDEITYEQLDLFTDYSALEEEKDRERKELEKEKNLQHAVLDIKKKFGKNAIVKGMNLEEGAMTIKRNEQIGGHKA
jgi:DNA polymerase V